MMTIISFIIKESDIFINFLIYISCGITMIKLT